MRPQRSVEIALLDSDYRRFRRSPPIDSNASTIPPLKREKFASPRLVKSTAIATLNPRGLTSWG
ncbi:hypothetical protein METHP14_520009 [Pseudomonas sp. P14-2025]